MKLPHINASSTTISNYLNLHHTTQQPNTTLHIHHSFSTGGSVLTLPCSQTANAGPGPPFPSPSAMRITPRTVHILRPTCCSSHSTRTTDPAGMGRRYVTLRVRLTPSHSQNPGRATRPKGSDVHRSKTVAVHPPCRLPRPLVCSGCTVKRKVICGCGGADECECMLRCGRMPDVQSWGFFFLLVGGCGERGGRGGCGGCGR